MSENTVVLPEAELAYNAQGAPYSRAFADVYHPAQGGREQARGVFLQGNELPARWKGRRSFAVLETGFGLGLNFLETWRAFDEDAHAPERLHYLSVENHPFKRAGLAQAHAHWPEHRGRSETLLHSWPLPLRGFHRLHFCGGRIILTLLLGDAQDLLPQLVASVDAFYLDGFSPAKNPQLWSAQIFAQLARLAGGGATLATWSVAANVRKGLEAAGFVVQKQPGWGGKREVLTARFAGTSACGASGASDERKAAVIGAGIGGTACAERLAARGWSVEVLEQWPAPAREASGNPVGFLTPLVNLADAPNARLSRAAFAYASRHFKAPDREGSARGHVSGVLRVLRDDKEAERLERSLRKRAFPTALARYVDTDEAGSLAGRTVSRPGVWFPGGATIQPALACEAHLTHGNVRARFDTRVAALRRSGGEWLLLDESGRTLMTTPTVVVACGLASMALVGGLRLEAVRGQISLLPFDPRRRLHVPVTGEGHAALLADGRLLIGASFQPGDCGTDVRVSDHAANIARVEAMLPGLCDGVRVQTLEGRAGLRAVTPDRLPALGASPGEHGLWIATGLGARGLAWAPLCAELLACQIANEPWPVERMLGQAVAPERFEQNAQHAS